MNLPRRRTRTLLVCFGLVAAAALTLLATGCMERFFFYPSRAPFPTPPGAVDVSFQTTDNLTLHGWFIPPTVRAEAPPPAVLVVHGNAGNISNHVAFADFLPAEGFAVFIFDYRSYGRSDLSPRALNRADLIADANAALDALLARPDVDPNRIAIYGVSIGAVLGLAVAAERPEIKSFVSLAAFSRWKDVAGAHTGFAGRALIRAGHDAADTVARLAPRPLLILHGDLDEVVPIAHADAIERAARSAAVPVECRRSPDATHNDLLWSDPGAPAAITAFLNRTLPALTPRPPG